MFLPRLNVSHRALRYFPPSECRPISTVLPGRWPLLRRLDHQSLLRTPSTGRFAWIPRPADTRHVDLLARTPALFSPPHPGSARPCGEGPFDGGGGVMAWQLLRPVVAPPHGQGAYPGKWQSGHDPLPPPLASAFQSNTHPSLPPLRKTTGRIRRVSQRTPCRVNRLCRFASRPSCLSDVATDGGGSGRRCEMGRAGGRGRPGGRELPPREAPRRRLQPRALGSRLAAGWRIRCPHPPPSPRSPPQHDPRDG